MAKCFPALVLQLSKDPVNLCIYESTDNSSNSDFSSDEDTTPKSRVRSSSSPNFNKKNKKRFKDDSKVFSRVLAIFTDLSQDRDWSIRSSCEIMIPKMCEIVGQEFANLLFQDLILEVMKDPNPYVLLNLYWQIELAIPSLMPNPES